MTRYVAAIVMLLAALSAPAYALERSFPAIQEYVEERYEEVEHIPPDSFAALDGDVVVFDVREEDEYAVSHIADAIQVDPDMDADDFVEKFSALVKGKTVIVYCSVGVRSSELAERVQPQVKAQGGKAVYNLTGGVFRWHNEGRALMRDDTPTKYVHPYDRSWGQLIEDQSLVRYEPGP